jgi:hypothetical protein
MSDPLQRADDLAVQVFYLLGEHWFGPPSFTDEEEEAALRTAAFCFSREVHGSEPLVLKARDIANAVLELLSPFRTPDSFEKLKIASNAYEQARLSQ